MRRREGFVVCRILAASDLERLDWREIADHHYPNGHTWYRLAKLVNGTALAINPSPDCSDLARDRLLRDADRDQRRCLVAICHYSPGTQGQPGRNPVVALSFTELLERMLDGGDRPYWRHAQFESYGDAEEYTRRE